MYSVVLMMALSGSADVPACHHHSCGGCYGCCGCYGGHGCCGCWGGCYGCGGGCWGGCYGCYGGGCWGGCWGYSCGGCWGGGYYGDGGVIVAPGAGMAPGATVAPGRRGAEEAPEPRKRDEEKPQGRDGGAMAPTPATIIVSLPADAKLIVDGNVTRTKNAVRVFRSPALEPGLDYAYTVKAEFVRDGQPTSATKRVVVRAGKETRVTFDVPEASFAQR